MNEKNKTEIISQINELLEFDKNSKPISMQVIEILDLEELISMRDTMLENKKFLHDESQKWLDEIYEKTKKE